MKKLMFIIAVALAAFAGGAAENAAAPIEVLGKPRYCTNGEWRVYYDFKVNADLADAKGIELETRLSNLKPFAGGTVYLESGKGWYRAGLALPAVAGAWHRQRLDKGAFSGTEGAPAGWRKISTIRVAYTFAVGEREAKGADLRVRGLASYGGDCDVMVLRADAANMKSTEKAISEYSATVCDTFDRLGVRSRQTSDLDVGPASFTGVKLVVLPWNPSVPDAVMAMLEKFVADGGKLIVCGTFPRRVTALLGLKSNGFWSNHYHGKGKESFVGFEKCGAGIPGQPDFAPQASWQTSLLEPVGAGEVIAVWRNGKGQTPTRRPAIVRTPRGFSIGHVWMGGEEGSDELMAALVSDAVPAYRAELAAACARLRDGAAAEQRWVESQQGRSGERRLMWCHSPFGMTGRDWDESVKVLRDGHFTDLVVNLLWGRLTAYPSDVWPSMKAISERGDQFELCKAACRKYGIRMHVWQVCWRLDREVEKDDVARLQKEGRLQLTREGKDFTHAARWLCPSHPQNRREVADAMIELAKKGADGVHFDYIRYPDGASCYCPRCRALFEKHLGHAVENWPKDAVKKYEREWFAFRKTFITETVRRAAQVIRRDYPEVEISAAVFRNPRRNGDADRVGQDWGAWCEEGLLDFACPMDYTQSLQSFESIIGPQCELAGKAKLYPGIGITCWQKRRSNLALFARQILATREAGFGGFSVFELNGSNAEEILPYLAKNVLRDDYRMPDRAITVENCPGYNSWPMIQAVGKRLVCGYSRGSQHTTGEGRRNAYVRYSDDGGRTWSREATLAADPKVGECNEGAGLDSTGAGLFWVRCGRGSWSNCRHELYRTPDGVSFEKISSPELKPWPIQVMDPVRVAGLGLVSPWFAGDYRKSAHANSWGILVSADDGRTWEQRTIEKDLAVADWVTEPSLVDLGGGKILIVSRCEQGLGTQFQVTSADGGRTWTKRRTNIGDVRESTPSLIYDAATDRLDLYYYHRGARELKRRTTTSAAIWNAPTAWPEPVVLDRGYERRAWDAGNVKATRLGDRDICAWYTGSPTNAAIVVTIVPR